MKLKILVLAGTALLASAGVTLAATVTNDLNLRSGPGANYGVIDTMPAGAYVNVIGCGGSWCRVDWHGRVGYASASYLGGGGGYAAAPGYAAPVYAGPTFYDEPFFAGPAIGFGFGGGGHHRWHGGYHGGGHHGGGHHGHHH